MADLHLDIELASPKGTEAIQRALRLLAAHAGGRAAYEAEFSSVVGEMQRDSGDVGVWLEVGYALDALVHVARAALVVAADELTSGDEQNLMQAIERALADLLHRDA